MKLWKSLRQPLQNTTHAFLVWERTIPIPVLFLVNFQNSVLEHLVRHSFVQQCNTVLEKNTVSTFSENWTSVLILKIYIFQNNMHR